MSNGKYYDWQRGCLLNSLEDGCSFLDWKENFCKKTFAIHDKGFLIFITNDELTRNDEYINGDPFGMEDNLNSPFQQGRIKTTINLITEIIVHSKSPIRILDVGCGLGHITAKIKEYFPSADLSAMDVSLTAITKAATNYKEIDFIVADAYSPPYTTNYFDVIVCNNMWEHITDPVRMLFALNKVLKTDGHIIISTPSRFRITNFLKASLGRKVIITKHHVTEYSVGQVKEQFSFAGFTVTKAIGMNVKGAGGSIITKTIVHNVLKPILKGLVAILGSHHVFESTAFYVAKKG